MAAHAEHGADQLRARLIRRKVERDRSDHRAILMPDVAQSDQDLRQHPEEKGHVSHTERPGPWRRSTADLPRWASSVKSGRLETDAVGRSHETLMTERIASKEVAAGSATGGVG